MTDWTGDLEDDCTLRRYGMLAHVECMGRGWWWFCITRGEFPNEVELYNTADNTAPIRLTTGKMARAAAECVMEVLRGGEVMNWQRTKGGSGIELNDRQRRVLQMLRANRKRDLYQTCNYVDYAVTYSAGEKYEYLDALEVRQLEDRGLIVRKWPDHPDAQTWTLPLPPVDEKS